MTGLVSIAPSANLGAWLVGAGMGLGDTPTPSGGLGATFLELLGFFRDGSAIDDTQPESESEANGPVLTAAIPVVNPLMPQISPKQIADAVIRSMLKGVKPIPTISEGIEMVPSDAARPYLAAVPVIKSEDWDVPLDWSAPEELAEFDLEPDEIPLGNPLPVTVVAEIAPSAQIPTPKAAEAGAASVAPRQCAQAILERTPSPVPLSAPRTAAPLAFEMRLTIVDPREAVPKTTETSSRAAVVVPNPEVPSLPVGETVRSGEAALAPPNAVVLSLPPESVATAPIEPVTSRPALASERVVPPQSVTGDEGKQTTAPNLSVDVSADQEDPDQRGLKPPATAKAGPAGEPKSPTRSEPAMLAPMAAHATGGDPSAAVPIHTPAISPGIREIVSAAPNGVPSAAQTVEEPHTALAHSSATHEIAVRISAPDAAPVDLQVRERGGMVHVAVRTADGGLQTSLRQDLGTLVDRLERSGFHAETPVTQELPIRMRPEAPQGFDLTSAFHTHAIEPARGVRADSDQPRDSDHAGRENHSPDSGARQHQQQRRQNSSQLKWLQAMEDQV